MSIERDSSWDEEDDSETLIEQNDRKHSSPRQSTFHIDAMPPPFPFKRLFLHKKYFVMVILFLPLFILILYFSTDIRTLFSSNLSFPNLDSVSDRMRESELQALYLLNQQLLSLVSLFNHSNPNNSSFNLEKALLHQVSLNKQIQQLLLSSHKSPNVSTEFNATASSELNSMCRRKVERGARKSIEWKPRSDKFLFALCLSGQMSNHLICLEKHMFFAALLNRVLVMPSPKFDYHYSKVLDIDHINDCLGRKAVISFDEFLEMRKNRPHIDRFICYFSSPTPCYVDEEHLKKLRGLGISMGGKVQSPWKEEISKPSKRSVEDVVAKFGSEDDVIAIGDVFYADVEQEWSMQPGGPISHKCNTLIEPSKLILLTAQRFVQTFLGNHFIALHFRRHGFLKFCNAKEPSCFYPIPQSADCIVSVAERANAPVIYLSTDAAESETSLLQSLVVLNGKTIPLVKRPPRSSAEKWDALLYRHNLQDDPQVEAMLDKTICAMSSVFIGSRGSTFTEDILRLRKDWQSAALCDEYLCQGELPNFIAENE